MSEKEIIKVLEMAERGELPDRIVGNSVVPFSIVKELCDSGFLDATNATSYDGPAYIDPRINVSGREYLKILKQQHHEASTRGKAKKIGVSILGWIGRIVAALIVAWFVWKYFK